MMVVGDKMGGLVVRGGVVCFRIVVVERYKEGW